MRRAGQGPGRAVLALAAVAGAVAAHGVAWVLAVPDASERHATLAATGHGWWPVTAAAALVAGTAAVVAAVHRGASGRSDRHTRLAPLVAWQVSGFAAMEAVERASVGEAPQVLLASPAFRLGIAVQVAAALLAVGVLRLLHRIGERVGDALHERPAPRCRPAPVRWRRDDLAVPRSSWSLTAAGRGPPAAAVR